MQIAGKCDLKSFSTETQITISQNIVCALPPGDLKL